MCPKTEGRYEQQSMHLLYSTHRHCCCPERERHNIRAIHGSLHTWFAPGWPPQRALPARALHDAKTSYLADRTKHNYMARRSVKPEDLVRRCLVGSAILGCCRLSAGVPWIPRAHSGFSHRAGIDRWRYQGVFSGAEKCTRPEWAAPRRGAIQPIIPITLWNKLAHEFMDFPMGRFLLLSSCTLKINRSFLLELNDSRRYS